MAVDDTISFIASVNAGDYLDMQPAGTVEWIIHNCGSEERAELYFYDGVNNVLRDSDAAPAFWARHVLHCTNTRYYRLKNIEANPKLMTYDGLVTHA